MIPKGPRKQNQYGFYYDDCGCLECQYARGQILIAPQGEVLPHQWEIYYAGLQAQDNANRSPAESKNDAPMTAEDLGLPLLQWDIDWLNAMYGRCQPPLWMWLGAEAA